MKLKRHFISLILLGICLLVLYGWWQSSRYSERHLIYPDHWTVEVFSASSLIRLSFVNGKVGQFGQRTFYRHRNARGKFTIRPAVPSAKKRPDMLDLTLGYWHLFSISVIGFGAAIVWERSSIRACSTRVKS